MRTCLAWLVFGLYLISLTGCIPTPERYSYASIQHECKDLLCRLNPARTDAPEKVARCILDKPVSLSEAIGIALANNPDNQVAAARIKAAGAGVAHARSVFYPTLGVYTEYMQGDAPSAYLFKSIDQRQLPDNADFNAPGWFENYETGITAGFNIYRGGQDVLKQQMAETGVIISELDRRSVENSLVASVIQAYYNCQLAKAFIQIANESVATVEEELRVMRVRFNAGGALKSDILSLEVRLAQARQDVVRSNNSLETTRTALAVVMGVSPEQKIELTGADFDSLPIPEGYETAITQAIAHRPELKRVREQIKQSRMALDMARSGYLPRVDALAKVYYDDSELGYSSDRENWIAAVILNWDLFTGFSTKASGNKAGAELEEALAADRKTLLAIKSDVRTAYLNLAEAKARLEVAQASVSGAEESLGLVRKQYEGGSATITRYLEAELDRNRAKLNAVAAFYDREKAHAEIVRALGLLGETFSPKQKAIMP